jgi:hypothetical protein
MGIGDRAVDAAATGADATVPADLAAACLMVFSSTRRCAWL